MAVNGGMGSSAGWRLSPYVRVWPPALHSAAFAPLTSDSTLHTSPPRSCVKKWHGDVKQYSETCSILFCWVTLKFFYGPSRNQGSATGVRQLTLGQHCVAGTVSGTRGNVVEEGTKPHRETTAASTTGRVGKKRHTYKQKYPHLLLCVPHFTYICFIFSVHQADLCEGVVVWRPAVSLFDELTVHFILQLRVGQAHLQSILGQRSVVIDRGRFD